MGKIYKSALTVNLFSFTSKVTLLANLLSDPSAKLHVLHSFLTYILVDLLIHVRRLEGKHVTCPAPPIPMTIASGGSPIFPLVVPQPASPSIWPAVQSLRRGLSTRDNRCTVYTCILAECKTQNEIVGSAYNNMKHHFSSIAKSPDELKVDHNHRLFCMDK